MYQNASHHISVVGDNFMLDGQRLHIVSGSLHYFRVPAAYWRDRLRKLKAAGLNSVATYDYIGILGTVRYNNTVLDGNWKITGYPLENVATKSFPTLVASTSNIQVPAFYEGQFTLPEGTPSDTFLDPTGWDKGYIWINGHNLGRYWPTVGPQVTLYVPGVWLKSGPEVNTIQILELNKSSRDLSIKFIDHPILDRRGSQQTWIQ